MLKIFSLKDRITKDIFLVFLGTSLVNIFNLFYQLFIVRKLEVADFAAFSSLISIAMILSIPATTVTQTINKFTAAFQAHQQKEKIIALLARFSNLVFTLSLILFIILCLLIPFLSKFFKITDKIAIFFMATIVLGAWILPIYSGALQGLEKFHWWTFSSIFGAALKLVLTVVFIYFSWGMRGPLAAFALSNFACLLIFLIPLKDYIFTKPTGTFLEFRQALYYLLPVALTYFCFNVLVSIDMVLVKRYFSDSLAGYYSVAQIIGKIFLFLSGPVTIAMFPKTAGLNARKQDTTHLLKRSIFYAGALTLLALLAYNLAPAFILKLLTAKDYPISISLGRFFSVSMSLYALVFALILYHLSIGDFRFIKSLVIFTFLEILAIILLHQTLFQVQICLCLNAFILFLINLRLALKERFVSYDRD